MWKGRILSVALVVMAGCSVQPQPVTKPLAARAWQFPSTLSISELKQAASEFGYEIMENDRGLFLRSERFYASAIDRYCVYPVINAKTGGRMHTFASWQAEMNRLPSYSGRAFGLIEVQMVGDGDQRQVHSFCRAFTQLGLQPADSTGVYEKELFDRLAER